MRVKDYTTRQVYEVDGETPCLTVDTDLGVILMVIAATKDAEQGIEVITHCDEERPLSTFPSGANVLVRNASNGRWRLATKE